jgi:hypothetical protein
MCLSSTPEALKESVKETEVLELKVQSLSPSLSKDVEAFTEWKNNDNRGYTPPLSAIYS